MLLDFNRITDRAIDELVALYETTAPALPQKVRYTQRTYPFGRDPMVTRTGTLASTAQIPDLLPCAHAFEHLILDPAGWRKKWYCQASYNGDYTYQTEVAFVTRKGNYNYGIVHEDGSSLNRAETVAVLAYFCQQQQLPEAYLTELTVY